MAKVNWNTLWNKLWAKKARPFTDRRPALPRLHGLADHLPDRRRRPGQGGPRGAAVAVEIAAVETGSIRDIGTFSGTLIPKSYFTVVPKISGRLKELYVDIGDGSAAASSWPSSRTTSTSRRSSRPRPTWASPGPTWKRPRPPRSWPRRSSNGPGPFTRKASSRTPSSRPAVSSYGTRDARHKVTLAQLANQQAALETAKVRLSYTRIRAAWETEAGRPLSSESASSTPARCSRRTRPSCRSSSSSRSRPSSTSPRRTISG